MGENVITPYAPSPGATAVGDLYADLQSRTLWLGVDTAVDPDGAVLISDIAAVEADIDQCLVDAKAYTDTRILTRAPTTHTHTASQITDFTPAVTAIANSIPGLQFTTGMIMMWSGSLAEVGVGSLANWSLCDGSNGTPDLRDRFVIGAGNKPAGSKNTIATSNLLSDTQGGHAHVLGGTAITTAQMPSHSHTGITSNDTVNHTHYISGYTSGGGNHNHSVGISPNDGSPDTAAGGQGYGPGPVTTSTNGDHQHTINFASGTVSAWHQHYVTAEGGGATHTHTSDTQGSHLHTMSSNAVREATPYFALAFIMKL